MELNLSSKNGEEIFLDLLGVADVLITTEPESKIAHLKIGKSEIRAKHPKLIHTSIRAFSSQSIAVIKELGLDESKVNIDGGAIAIGHPLGASGARITGKAASLIQRTNSQRAVATMCIGGGMGIAIALESP